MPGQPIRGMTNLPSHKPDRQQAGPASTATRKPFKQLKLIDVGLSLSLSRSSLSFLSLSLSLSPSHYIFLSLSLSLPHPLLPCTRDIQEGRARQMASKQSRDSSPASQPLGHPDKQPTKHGSGQPDDRPATTRCFPHSLPLPLPLAVSEGIGAEDIKQTRRLLSDIYIYIYTVDT